MDTQRKPGWYGQPDLQPGQKRYWDGQQWTDRLTNAPNTGSVSVAWGIILAVLIIGCVAFGVINLLSNVSKT